MIRRPRHSPSLPIALAAALLLTGCGPRATPAPTATPDPTAVAEAQVPMPVLAEHAPRGAAPPPGFEGRDWSDVLDMARGRTVRWYVGTGDPRLGEFLGDYVADVALNRYEIEVEVVTAADAPDALSTLLESPEAGAATEGGIDLVWLDDAGLEAQLRAAGRLYGPWTGFLPSAALLDEAYTDGARAPEGDAMPWGRLQLVLVYDSTRVAEPPRTIAELLAFAEANPGSFTYPAPPDLVGRAFVSLACRASATDPAVDALLAAPVDEAALAVVGPPCWQALAALEPALGTDEPRHPATAAELDARFAGGGTWFSLSERPTAADLAVADGQLDGTARTAVLDGGTWSRAHHLAIPTTAAERAAAMVLANFLLSPEGQFAKAQPSTWGDLTVLDLARIPDEWRAAFADLKYGPATLPPDVLREAAIPAPDPSWAAALDAGWRASVAAPEGP